MACDEGSAPVQQPRWEEILNAVDDAIFLLSSEGVILSWNPAAERMFEFTPQEAIGSLVTDMFPAEQVRRAMDDFDRVMRGEALPRIDIVHVRRDGRAIDTIVHGFPARDAERRIVGALVIARDVTEHREFERSLNQLEKTAESRARILATANQVALDILSSHTGVEALRDIAEAAVTLTQAKRAGVTVCRPDKPEEIREVVTAGMTLEEDMIVRRRLPALPLHALLLSSDGPLRINKPQAHPVLSGIEPILEPIESFLGLALRNGDTLHGTLYLVNKQGGGGFTEDDESAVQALAPYAAVATRNMLMLSRLNALVSGLMAAQEEERVSLAYDLHDGLTQFVMAAHMHLEAFKAAQESSKQERAARELDRGLDDLKKAVTESRRLVNGLRLLILDDLGLAGALEQLLTEEKARAGWEEAEFIHNLAERRFDRTLETAIYRVAQEALTNARKHAKAERVRLLLLEERDEKSGETAIRLEIKDSGCGFVPEEKLTAEGRIGLHSMQERAALLGATFDVFSAPGQGTVVRVVLPLRPLSSEQQAAIGEMP